MALPVYVQAAVVVVASFALGVAAHEASHVAALRLAGIPCSVAVLPDDDGPGRIGGLLRGAFVRVEPTRRPGEISPWHLRGAALMPLCLSLPLVLIFAGVVTDPFSGGSLASRMALITWVGCAIPSPRDFSLAWYPEQAIAAASDGP